ncbi:MAG: hypothetical protein GXP48_02155 [Acidobacteria bacterium]|nr:hypothetical protein [Acidobacteriota bacterium]
MRRWGATLLLLGATALVPRAAYAQLFGQWSWNALLSLEQRSFLTETKGSALTDYKERGFRLDLGMNGFIIHPAIARFRLGLDTLVSNYTGTAAPDNKRWGLHAQLTLLPYSRYPTYFHLTRTRYNYTLNSEDPLATTGLADTTRNWGARIRFRGGLLRGLAASTDRTDTSFVDPAVRNEVFLRQYLDWAGASGRINHHYRLERQYRRYGRTRYTTDDYTLTVDEHGLLSDRWRWDLSGVGFHRSFDYENTNNTVDTARLRNRIVYTTHRDDLIDLSYTGGFSHAKAGRTATTNAVTARYVWNAASGLQVTPTVSYSVQHAGDTTVNAPATGVSLSWSHIADRYDLSLNGGLSGAWIDTSWNDGSQKTTVMAWTAGSTVGTGSEDHVRAELDLSLAHNELRTVGDALVELPDLGTEYERIGLQNSFRSRLTLRRRIRRWHLSTYLEHRHREQESARINPVRVSSNILDVTLSGPGIGFTLDTGKTQGRSGFQQDVSFFAANIHWMPLRYLTLRSTYLTNVSNVSQGPDIHLQRIEGTAQLHFGRYTLDAKLWDQTETIEGSLQRTRGVLLTFSARFAGWLPFVSAPQRRGIIR